MKTIFVLLLITQTFALNNRSQQEFEIRETSPEPEKFPVLQPISEQPQQITTRNIKPQKNQNSLQSLDNTGKKKTQCINCNPNPRPGSRNNEKPRRSVDSSAVKIDVMIPEQAQNSISIEEKSVSIDNTQKPVELTPLNSQNIDGGRISGPRFISFGIDKASDLQYQNLLSKILNFGMLSMFTDLTDQGSKISLMLVLKQDRQIAGKEIYKVIFRVDNPKYVTGTIFYGAEFAVNAGVTDPNPNQIDFISFGKSVLFDNLLGLLGIDQDVAENRASLDLSLIHI